MLIRVTAEDITAGLQKSCFYCPVALAISRVIAGFWEAAVTESGEHFQRSADVHFQHSETGERITMKLPDEAGEWISDFDLGWKVEPIEFELPIPERVKGA